MKERHVEAVRNEPGHEREHAFVRENLPWHVTDALDPLASRRVSAHLEVCAECRGDFEREGSIARTIGATPIVDLAPQAGLAKLMTRIEVREARRARFARLLRPLAGERAHRPLVFTVAIQAAVIVMLTGVVVSLSMRSGPPAAYRTLSNPASQPAAGATLRVVFDKQLTLADVHALLAPLDARIVAGPAANGLVTLQVPGAARDALVVLRAQPGVRLAEIVAE